MTPRTLQAKAAWWLAAASIALSIFSIMSVSFKDTAPWSGGAGGEPHLRRVVLKSFLLTPGQSEKLHQAKPLLLAEEELTDEEINFLYQDQLRLEEQALAGRDNAANERANVVHQLVAEYLDGEEVTEETIQELQRRWQQYSRTEEDQGPDVYDEGFTDDVAGGSLEFWDDNHYDEGIQLLQPEPIDPQDIELVEPSDRTWIPGGASGDNSVHPSLNHADVLEAPRPGPEASFLEVLSTCRSLECLREAHTRVREEGQLNFPHALLIGWQKSATTSIYGHLDRHPDVLASEPKEPEFFSLSCKANPTSGCPIGQQAWYIERTLQRDEFLAGGGRSMVFEASTHYAMNGDVLAKGVAKALPWVKIVASLREPISRASSMLVHMSDKGMGCLSRAGADLFTCLTTASQLLGNPGPFDFMDSPHGNYTYALRHWLEAFPRDQVHVLQYEKLMVSKTAASEKLGELKDFLGLDPALPEGGPQGLDKHNLRKDSINPDGWPMRREQYQQLIDMVKPDAEEVAAMVEEFGHANGKEWLALWEQVWEDNLLNNCDAGGDCLIKLS